MLEDGALETAGVIGAGVMGSTFIQQLVAARLKTLVYDVSPAAMDRAVSLGATACSSPAELARQADVVDVIVATDEQVLDCVLGNDGVLQGLPAGRILLLHSTILPSTTRTVAQAAQARGVDVADACITSVPRTVRGGTPACIVGGAPDVIERIRPHLLHLAPNVFHVGPLGCGNVAKIMRNLVNTSDALVLHEVFQFAHAAGIAPDAMVDVLNHVYDNRDLALYDTAYKPEGPAGNLYETILPRARQLADEYGLRAPTVRLLASAEGPLV